MKYLEFTFQSDAQPPLHCLICKGCALTDGGPETGFLDTAGEIRSHPDGAPFLRALDGAAARAEGPLAIIRNPEVVLDDGLPARLVEAAKRLSAMGDWALAGSGGLGLHDRRHLALYVSDAPAVPDRGSARPLLDVVPDLYLANLQHLRRVLAGPVRFGADALEAALVTEGSLSGLPSVFLPELSAGVNGSLLSRDVNRLRAELRAQFSGRLTGQTVPTLSGEVAIAGRHVLAGNRAPDLRAAVSETVAQHVQLPTLSIVTRTRFDRPYLLRRLLASISRARHPGIELEIVLSTDVPLEQADRELAALRADFVNLTIRLTVNDADGHSRVRNALGGIKAARNDYVMLIDDDDYVDLGAFDALLPAFFQGARPLIITSSAVHSERWEEQSGARAILAESSAVNRYPASGWRTMFSGVNALPVNALIIPRKFLLNRLQAFTFRHDLSEDYALALLILTAPDLPEIWESPADLVHISLRETGNSVTIPDRRPWVRDISGYLRDLTQDRGVAGPGHWDVLSAQAPAMPSSAGSIADLSRALSASEADLNLLLRENQRLRAELAVQKETVS